MVELELPSRLASVLPVAQRSLCHTRFFSVPPCQRCKKKAINEDETHTPHHHLFVFWDQGGNVFHRWPDRPRSRRRNRGRAPPRRCPRRRATPPRVSGWRCRPCSRGGHRWRVLGEKCGVDVAADRETVRREIHNRVETCHLRKRGPFLLVSRSSL